MNEVNEVKNIVKSDAELIEAIQTSNFSILSESELKKAFTLLASKAGIKGRISTAKPYEARSFSEILDVCGGESVEGYKALGEEDRETVSAALGNLVLALSPFLEKGVKACIEFDSRGMGQARLKELWITEQTGDKKKKVQCDLFEAIDGKPTVSLIG